MGGYVTILVRFSDGEILGRTVHTNNFYIQCKKLPFQKEDKNFIKSILSGPDTYECFYPEQYGFTYFDFINRQIYDSQCYSNVIDITYSEFNIGRYSDDDILNLLKNKICKINNITSDYKEFVLVQEIIEKYFNNGKKINDIFSFIIDKKLYNLYFTNVTWKYKSIENIDDDDRLKIIEKIVKELNLSNELLESWILFYE